MVKPVTFSITVSPEAHFVLGEMLRLGLWGKDISEVAERIICDWIWKEMPNEILLCLKKNMEAR
jgi:hypothetical protein